MAHGTLRLRVRKSSQRDRIRRLGSVKWHRDLRWNGRICGGIRDGAYGWEMASQLVLLCIALHVILLGCISNADLPEDLDAFLEVLFDATECKPFLFHVLHETVRKIP